MSEAPVKSKGSKKKQRIGHGHPDALAARATGFDESVPRGWIHPTGKFFATNHHWEAITRMLHKKASKDPEKGERDAHLAYSLGWISIGHGGATNAIGHKSVFDGADHPAVEALRKLVAKIPHFSLRIEKQIGKRDPESGRHADFDVSEYDLDLFIRRGRLRKTT